MALVKKNKHRELYTDQVPIILDYNIQYKKIERIIQHHWHILQIDRHLHSILPNKPQIYL